MKRVSSAMSPVDFLLLANGFIIEQSLTKVEVDNATHQRETLRCCVLQIPNPLFDLAGITCGHFLVPFWTFFGATLIGKAVIKTHLQQLTVIVAFNENLVQTLVSFLANVGATRFLLKSLSFELRFCCCFSTSRCRCWALDCSSCCNSCSSRKRPNCTAGRPAAIPA